MMLKEMNRKKRLGISLALALGTVLPPLGGTVSAGATVEITANGVGPKMGGSSDDDGVTVEDNTLILKNGVTYSGGEIFGGYHSGIGNAKNNTLKIEDNSTLNMRGYGGFVRGGLLGQRGDAIENHVIVEGGIIGAPFADIYGGVVKGKFGNAIKNDVEIQKGTINGTVFGGALLHLNAEGTVKGNLVTLRGTQATTKVTKDVSGGFVATGTGRVEENHVVIEGGKVVLGVTGGRTDARGDVVGNTVTMSGDSEVAEIVGGSGKRTTGEVKGNKVFLKGGKVNGRLMGGLIENTGSGNATQNEVTVEGGEVANAVYGAMAQGGGNATGNTVTIKGGKLNDIYGGAADGAGGATTGNTVNLGDGVNSMAAGYQIKKIYGGDNAVDVTGNTLNVKTNVTAENIENFAKIKFCYKETAVDLGATFLTLTDAAGTTIPSLAHIEADGELEKVAFGKSLSLMKNAGGITITDAKDTKSDITGNIEKNIRHVGNTIYYDVYQFKNADVTPATAITDGVSDRKSTRLNSSHGS